MTRLARILSLVVTFVAVTVPLVASALPAAADTPLAASGNGTVAFIPNGPPRLAGGNLIFDATLRGAVNGTLSGTWSEQGILVVHPDGSETTHAMGTFTVATPCGAGAFAFSLDAQQPSATSNLTGKWRSVEQSSNTLTIHTIDTFTTAPNSGIFTYSGMYSC